MGNSRFSGSSADAGAAFAVWTRQHRRVTETTGRNTCLFPAAFLVLAVSLLPAQDIHGALRFSRCSPLGHASLTFRCGLVLGVAGHRAVNVRLTLERVFNGRSRRKSRLLRSRFGGRRTSSCHASNGARTRLRSASIFFGICFRSATSFLPPSSSAVLERATLYSMERSLLGPEDCHGRFCWRYGNELSFCGHDVFPRHPCRGAAI
jgi:hypothetical protein